MMSQISFIKTKQASYWLLFLLLVIFAVSFSGSFRLLIGSWLEGEEAINRSGFVIVGCSAYLLFLKRRLIWNTELVPSSLGLLALLACVFIWLLGRAGDIRTIYLGILPAILMSMVLIIFGRSVFKLAFIPLLILFFSIPMWWPLIPGLQDIATVVSKFVLNVIGMPVLVEGNVLHLPGGSFFIDESCAGLRFLIVTLTLSFLCYDLFGMSAIRGSMLVIGAVLLALLANWVRILIVVLIGNYTEMQSELVNDHYTLGWIVYSFLVLLPIFLYTRTLPPEPDVVETSDAATHSELPDHTSILQVRNFCICALLIVAAPNLISASTNPFEAEAKFIPPNLVGQWVLRDLNSERTDDDWHPAFSNESSFTRAEYYQSDRTLNLYYLQFDGQIQDVGNLELEDTLADDETWSIESGSTRSVNADLNAEAKAAFSSVILVNRANEKKLVWYQFLIDRRTLDHSVFSKIVEFISIDPGPADRTLVTISMSCLDNCESASNNVEDFVRNMAEVDSNFFRFLVTQ